MFYPLLLSVNSHPAVRFWLPPCFASVTHFRRLWQQYQDCCTYVDRCKDYKTVSHFWPLNFLKCLFYYFKPSIVNREVQIFSFSWTLISPFMCSQVSVCLRVVCLWGSTLSTWLALKDLNETFSVRFFLFSLSWTLHLVCAICKEFSKETHLPAIIVIVAVTCCLTALQSCVIYSRVLLENPEVTHSMKQNSDTCGVSRKVFWPLAKVS